MDSLISFVKENFQLILLVVGLLGVVVSIFSLVYELKVRKRKKEQKGKNEEK